MSIDKHHYESSILHTEGVKYDEDKLRYDLIPPEVLEALAYIFTIGAKKYAERNCELGMDWGRIYSACWRHLNSWWSGDVIDDESKKSHLWHALWNIAMLVTYESRNIGTDTRSDYARKQI